MFSLKADVYIKERMDNFSKFSQVVITHIWNDPLTNLFPAKWEYNTQL